jgi:hypothetical protein
MWFDVEREADKFLMLLIITDIFFMLFHVLHVFHTSTGFFYDPNFSLQQDRGYAEVFQYIKEFWSVMLLLILAVRASNLLYFCWSLLFGYFLVDDSMGVHETLGNQLSNTLESLQLFGLNAQELSELFVSGFFGLLFLIAIGASYYRNNDEAKRFSQYLFAMLVFLVVFGVIIGLFQGLFTERPVWQFLFNMLEEGGEMLVMSVMVWFVLRFNSELEG